MHSTLWFAAARIQAACRGEGERGSIDGHVVGALLANNVRVGRDQCAKARLLVRDAARDDADAAGAGRRAPRAARRNDGVRVGHHADAQRIARVVVAGDERRRFDHLGRAHARRARIKADARRLAQRIARPDVESFVELRNINVTVFTYRIGF